MAKIWWEPYSGQPNPMLGELGEAPGPSRHWRSPTLEHPRVLFVRVARFTFIFHTAEQLRACLEFYRRKILPSSRSAARGEAVASGEVHWRLHVERWYERLPLYFREEPKRAKVVAALEEASRQAAAADFD